VLDVWIVNAVMVKLMKKKARRGRKYNNGGLNNFMPCFSKITHIKPTFNCSLLHLIHLLDICMLCTPYLLGGCLPGSFTVLSISL